MNCELNRKMKRWITPAPLVLLASTFAHKMMSALINGGKKYLQIHSVSSVLVTSGESLLTFCCFSEASSPQLSEPEPSLLPPLRFHCCRSGMFSSVPLRESLPPLLFVVAIATPQDRHQNLFSETGDPRCPAVSAELMIGRFLCVGRSCECWALRGKTDEFVFFYKIRLFSGSVDVSGSVAELSFQTNYFIYSNTRPWILLQGFCLFHQGSSLFFLF